jgi:hypothetical protein
MTDTTTTPATTQSRRADLLKDWGFNHPWNAEQAFLAARDDGKPLPATPALSFTSREGYLAARAYWRARQKAIEAEIRALKKARKGNTDAAHAAAYQATVWRTFARAALLERRLQKAEAARQVAAARAALEAAAEAVAA